MISMDDDAMLAGAQLVGRTGAQGLEVGYLHDDVPAEQAGWYAHAQYRGARITTEDHRGAVEAVEALARRLLEGGKCTNCGGLIALSDAGAIIHDGALGPDGKPVWTKETAVEAKQCRWRRIGPRWTAGCEKGGPPAREAGPNRKLRRRMKRQGFI